MTEHEKRIYEIKKKHKKDMRIKIEEKALKRQERVENVKKITKQQEFEKQEILKQI